MKKKKQKIKGYVPIPVPNAQAYIEEICRGVGSAKPKKGKGSYRRNDKYK